MVYGTCVNYTVYVALGVTRMIHGCVTPRVYVYMSLELYSHSVTRA